MDLIEQDAVLYKRVGPTMIVMEKKEILDEIDGRISIMSKQLKKLESNIKESQKIGLEAKKNMQRLENEFKYAIAKAQQK